MSASPGRWPRSLVNDKAICRSGFWEIKYLRRGRQGSQERQWCISFPSKNSPNQCKIIRGKNAWGRERQLCLVFKAHFACFLLDHEDDLCFPHLPGSWKNRRKIMKCGVMNSIRMSLRAQGGPWYCGSKLLCPGSRPLQVSLAGSGQVGAAEKAYVGGSLLTLYKSPVSDYQCLQVHSQNFILLFSNFGSF